MLGQPLSTAHRGDDFDTIAGGQWRHCVTAFRDDFAVALDSDALALESELANEVGHRRGWIATNMDRAIDQEREHAGGSIAIRARADNFSTRPVAGAGLAHAVGGPS